MDDPRLSQQLEQQLQQLEQRRQQRQALQTAQQFVEQLLERQRNVERQVSPTQQSRYPKLANDQQKLEQELDQFSKSHAEAMRPCTKPAADAQQAMGDATRSLRESGQRSQAPEKVKAAGDRLQQLAQSLENEQQRSRLEDAYTMKRMMDQQMERLGQCRKSGASSGACRQMAGGSQSLSGQLRRLSEEPGAAEQLGSQLAQSLGDQQMGRIGQAAGQLRTAQNQEGRRAAAGRLQQQLDPVAKALGKSCPQSLTGPSQQPGSSQQAGAEQQAGGSPRPGHSSLNPSSQEALQRGLRTLRSAAAQQARGRPLSPSQRQQAGREATNQLEAGLTGLYGHNEQTRRVLDRTQQLVQEREWPVNVQEVRRLEAEIERLRREGVRGENLAEEPAARRDVSADRIPPAYRQSVQRYFEKLSEGQ